MNFVCINENKFTKTYKMKKNIALLFILFFLSSKVFCQTNDRIINTLNKLIEDRKIRFKNTRDTLVLKDDAEQKAAYKSTEDIGSNTGVIVDDNKSSTSIYMCNIDYGNFSKERIDSVQGLIKLIEMYIDAINVSVQLEDNKFFKREYNDDEKYFVTELSDKKGDLVLTLSTGLDDKSCSIIIYSKGYAKPKMFKRTIPKLNKKNKSNIKRIKK
jgi:hypothetical protein